MANRIHVMRVLADILEEKKAKEKNAFDMSSFIDFDSTFLEGALAHKDELVLEAGVSPSTCGTTLCVAGFAAIEAGWTATFKKATKVYAGYNNDGSDYVDTMVKTYWTDPDGKDNGTYGPEWELVGAEYLELEPAQAQILFYATHDDGSFAIAILERLARGDEITTDEWLEYNETVGRDLEQFGEPWYTVEDDEDDEDEGPCDCCNDDDEAW
jgi:hypothetical protein